MRRALVAVGLIGCGRVGFAMFDGGTVDGPPLAEGPWGTPAAVTGVNSGSAESDPSITADRKTLVLTRRNTTSTDTDIVIATRPGPTGPFLTLVALTAANSAFDEASPEISADGRTLYFVSDRSGLYQVYMSVFTTTWSAPVLVPELSTAEAADVAVAPNGLTAFVVQSPGSNRVFEATRPSTTATWGTLVDLPSLEFMSDVDAPTLTDDGQLVFFHAGSTRDLFTAHRNADRTYEMPTPVTELNTAGRDAAPFVSATADLILFDRAGDIFEASR